MELFEKRVCLRCESGNLELTCGTTLSLILEILKSNFSQIVLEIESLDPKATDYLQRVKRSKFYNNHGFKDSGYKISYCKMTYSIYSNFELDSKQFIDMFNLFKSKNYFDFKFE